MSGGPGDDLGQDAVPNILLCGPHRGGKTSIMKVVFQKISPHETLFLEPTKSPGEVTLVKRNALVRFKVLDFPESVLDTSEPVMFGKFSAVVFVIDAQEEPYNEALALAKKVIELSHSVNQKISFDILIHKVDGDQFFEDEHKTDIRREIHGKLMEELNVDGQIAFHCTSIYDNTVFEAFSKVVRRIIPTCNLLEHCLDLLIANSRMEKAFLFDVVSKICIASDAQNVDPQSYELCSDMIDAVIDISCIYGMPGTGSEISSAIACDAKSSCIIHLNNGTLLYLREVERCLALVCILREENFDRQHLLDHNIKVFKESLIDIIRTQNMPDPC